MGAGKLTTAVVDAGPLIHLSEIGCLQFLDFFAALHIPDAVWRETVVQNRVSQGSIETLQTIKRHNLPSIAIAEFIAEHHFEDLHGGERECLYLCRHLGLSTLLTDDMAVRDAAKRLNVTPVGSLGIIVRAHHLGNISLADAERHLVALYEVSSLFVTRDIVDLSIEQLRRRVK